MYKAQKNRFNSSLFIFIIIAIIVCSIFFLYQVFYRKQSRLRQLKALTEQLDKKKLERAELSKKVYDLRNKPIAIEQVAREKLRLCRDGEVILLYDKKELDKE